MTKKVTFQRIWIATVHNKFRNNLKVIYRHWLCELNRCVLSSKIQKANSITCLKHLPMPQMTELRHSHPLGRRISSILILHSWTSTLVWVQTLENHLLVWESCWVMIHCKSRCIQRNVVPKIIFWFTVFFDIMMFSNRSVLRIAKDWKYVNI